MLPQISRDCLETKGEMSSSQPPRAEPIYTRSLQGGRFGFQNVLSKAAVPQ